MKRKMRKKVKIIATMLVVLLVANYGLHCPGLLEVKAETQSWTSGDCTVTWDGVDTFTVSGNGAMMNYESYSKIPWYKIMKKSGIHVVVEEGVTRVGDRAFGNGERGMVIRLPKSLKELGYSCFASTKKENITVADGMLIELDSGKNHYKLSSDGHLDVTANDTETVIVNMPFCGISTFITSMSIDKDVIELATKLGSTSITEVTIPDGVTELGGSCFSSSKELRAVKLSENLVKIGPSCFNGCESLTEIEIPSTVTSVGDYAFSNTKLKRLEISNKVTYLGADIVANCNYLEELTVPLSLVSEYLFNGEVPEKLKKVTLSGEGDTKVIPDGLGNIVSKLEAEGVEVKCEFGGNRFSSIGNYGLANSNILDTVILEGESIGAFAFSGSSVETLIINTRANYISMCYNTFSGSNIVKVIINAPNANIDSNDLSSECKARIYYIDCKNMDALNVPKDSTVYCKEDSVVAGLCNSKGIRYVILTEEEWNTRVGGTAPNMSSQKKYFNHEEPRDVIFKYSAGTVLQESAVKRMSLVMDGVVYEVSKDSIVIDDSSIILKTDYLETLMNGVYDVIVELNNGDYFDSCTLSVSNMPAKPESVKDLYVFDYSQYNIVGLKFSLGCASLAATGISKVELNGELVDTSNYSIVNNELRIADEYYREKLKDSNNVVSITFNDSESTVDYWDVKVINKPKDVEPSVGSTVKLFDIANPNDVTYNVFLGTGSLKVTINKINIGGKDVAFSVIDEKSVVLNKDSLASEIEVGLYDVDLLTSDGSVLIGLRLKVINTGGSGEEPTPTPSGTPSKPTETPTLTDELPSVEKATKVYDANSGLDVVFNINMGSGSKEASSVSAVYIEGNKIANSNFEVTGSALVMKKESFTSLTTGKTYTLNVQFDNGVLDSNASVYIVGNIVIPENGVQVLDTVIYKFYKDYPSDIRIPITTVGNVSVAELQIGNTNINNSNYRCEMNTVTINSACLLPMNEGAYGLVIKFNDVKQTIISNIVIEVRDAFADSEKPVVMQSFVATEEISDVVMMINLGSGATAADSIAAIAIDNIAVDEDGNSCPVSEFVVKEATGSAIGLKTVSNTVNRAEDNEVGASVALTAMERIAPPPVEAPFSIFGNKIVVKGDFLKSLGLGNGVHVLGAIFNDTNKTVSYGTILAVGKMYTTSEGGTQTPTPTPETSGSGGTSGLGSGPAYTGGGSNTTINNYYGYEENGQSGSGSNTTVVIPTEKPTQAPKAEVPYVTMEKYMPAETIFRLPVYNTDGLNVLYSSAKNSIASVNSNGVITAKKKGKTTITCVIADKDGNIRYKVSVRIIVTKKAKNGLKTTFAKYKSTIKNTPYLVLNKKLHPNSNTTLEISHLNNEYDVEIKSSNSKIVTATKDGTIHAKKAGKAVLTITIKSAEKKFVYVYNVTVVKS